MALTRPTATWSTPVLTLAADTVFQAQAGTVLLDIGGTATDDMDGFLLRTDFSRSERDSIIVPAGTDVRWRAYGSGPNTILYYAALG